MQALPPFELERYFAEHEFTAKYPLSSSDCESLSIGDLLTLSGVSGEVFNQVWLGYTESLGHPDLRNAIATLYPALSFENILVHSGAEEAIYNFGQCFLEPTDHVIVHTPCYQSLFQIAASRGCEVTKWQAQETQHWELDLNFLSASLKKNTKAVIVNFPHNPTGHLPSHDWFKDFVGILRKHGIFLFMDEVYRGLEYDSTNRLPTAAQTYENALSLGVMSKSFGLAGLRIGWIATQNKDVFQKMVAFKDYTTICNSAPSEFLATLAMHNTEKLWDTNLTLIKNNLAALKSLFVEFSDSLEWVIPKAGCIAFPKLKSPLGADQFCKQVLESKNVLLAPGKFFLSDNHHFRMGYGRRSFPEAFSHFHDFMLLRS